MTIVYKILPDGGFVAGYTESKVTSYAYPSSAHASKARKAPAKVADQMIRFEIPWAHESELGKEYDRKNWEILNKS